MKILGEYIPHDKKVNITVDIAKLYNRTPLNMQVIVQRGKLPGPTIMLLGGVHGDEVNGVEIVRQMLASGVTKPECGTVISIPVFNVFGFLNKSRTFPDGRDSNRVFPGSSKGSLASRCAHYFITELAPLADYTIDFHTGGAQRNNAAQIRCVFSNKEQLELAKVFRAPFMYDSSYISKTLRQAYAKLGKTMLLFEGGSSNTTDQTIINEGIEGTKRILAHLKLRSDFKFENKAPSIEINKSRWLRASASGMFKVLVKNGNAVSEGEVLGIISDPFGDFEKKVKATKDGYVFCVNESPLVHQGDALFHLGY